MTFHSVSAGSIGKSRKSLIKTILAFLDQVAEKNARNRNYEPFGL
ncbi:hypothetical protein [Aquamicrobium terrae]|uniref:Uncharacterized protein n=1 Tax=Aquamicrobium terrae TaxID=1324945 RepID=A0ABV2N5H8_9HYPH